MHRPATLFGILGLRFLFRVPEPRGQCKGKITDKIVDNVAIDLGRSFEIEGR
jgi:hypothetical protein